MDIKVNKVFHELEISDFNTDNRSIRLLTGQEKKNYDPGKKKYLNLYTSLMASPSGLFCKDLKKNKEVTHHFEWQFGVSAPSAVSPVFDWVGALREDRSICIQVLVETPGPDCECIVTQADMNGFRPFNTMKDESTNYLSLAGSIIGGMSPIPMLSKAMGALTSKAEKQDAAKYENRIKNMFRLFRFLTDKGEQGIEYVLTKDVLSQWGTFLKGSFNVCFVRDASGSAVLSPYHIKLLPKLGFKEDDHLCYLPRPEQAEAVKAELTIEVKE